jgi:hypothetical protein
MPATSNLRVKNLVESADCLSVVIVFYVMNINVPSKKRTAWE